MTVQAPAILDALASRDSDALGAFSLAELETEQSRAEWELERLESVYPDSLATRLLGTYIEWLGAEICRLA